MRIANQAGRLKLIHGQNTVIDVHSASGGRLPAAPEAIYEHWQEFVEWAAGSAPKRAGPAPIVAGQLANPSPAPRQVFAIGLNYTDHAAEAKLPVPEFPTVFTKFPTCLGDPFGEIGLPKGNVDWEVELVVVMGRRTEGVDEARAWRHVAGLCVGQDISERRLQLAGPAPQFSLGKSYTNFGPVGPVLVTPDELPDPDDLEIGALLNDEVVQKGRTSSMVFSVSALISRLSAVTTLLPGDLIFTGTPSGVGMARKPPRYLKPGDELVSYVQGIGEMRHTMVAK